MHTTNGSECSSSSTQWNTFSIKEGPIRYISKYILMPRSLEKVSEDIQAC